MGACVSRSQAQDGGQKPQEKPTQTEKAVTEKKVEEKPKAEEKAVEQPKAEEKPVEQPKAEEKPAEQPKADEKPAEEPKAEEKPAEEPKEEAAPDAAPTDATAGVSASGKKLVSDGKVEFYEEALSIAGVFKTRDEEVATLELAIKTKGEAVEATKKANALHDEGKIEESKPFRAEAKEKHAKALELQKAAAESMLIKAIHSDKPEIDYHVFLLEGFTETFPTVWERMKTERKNKENKIFLVIPGAGTHSVGKPLIKPKLFEFLDQNGIKYEEETHGSYRCYLE